jgi:hypothetical protein
MIYTDTNYAARYDYLCNVVHYVKCGSLVDTSPCLCIKTFIFSVNTHSYEHKYRANVREVNNFVALYSRSYFYVRSENYGLAYMRSLFLCRSGNYVRLWEFPLHAHKFWMIFSFPQHTRKNWKT